MSGKRQNRGYKKDNTYMYIAIGVGIVCVIAFILAYVLYANKLANESKIARSENSTKVNTAMIEKFTNTEATATSTSIGKSINEITNEIATNEQEKVAVNTSRVEENVVEQRNITRVEDKAQPEQTVETFNKQTEEPKEEMIVLVKPVEGEVIKDYASDTLIYSNTLEEWTTHLGIDYAAEKTSIVKAAAAGTVKSVKNDPRYGLTAVIEHEGGYTTMYANLLSTEFIQVGETVEQGQTIATVGNTATFEISDETHLHFELLKDGVNVDPNLYIR